MRVIERGEKAQTLHHKRNVHDKGVINYLDFKLYREMPSFS